MAKSPNKLLDIQSKQRTSVHLYIKVKIPKNLQQQSSHKTEATKVNAITEQLDELDGNGKHRRNKINHFAPIY